MIRVLGKVELNGDRATQLGTGRARELLAYLVARGDQPASTEEIISALWETRPPASATTIVHGAVRRIRSALDADAVTHGEGGYRLSVARSAVDLWRVDDLAEQGDVNGARALWREPAFGPYRAKRWAQSALESRRAILHPDPSSTEMERVRRRVPVNRLIGRRRELAAVKRAARESRLVTLVGLGGVGKTRLALEALAQSHSDRVLHVDVGAAVGPVAARVLAELGQSATDDSVADLRAAAAYVGHAEVTLLVDGCEHDIAGSAQLVEHLLGSCPQLHVLATSRHALGVAGEHLVPVLPFSDPADPRGDAVELLLARASSMGLEIRPEDRARAAKLCVRAAGVPLAIELGAAELLVSAGRAPSESSAPVIPEAAVRSLVRSAVDALSASTLVAARRASLLVAGFSPQLVGGLAAPGSSSLAIAQELVASGLVVTETTGADRRLRFLDRVRDELRSRATGSDLTWVHRAGVGLLRSVRPDLNEPIVIPRLVICIPALTNVDGLVAELQSAGRSIDCLELVTVAAPIWAEDGHWAHGARQISAARAAAGEASPLAQAHAVLAEAHVVGVYDGLRRLLPELRTAIATTEAEGDQALEAHLRVHAAGACGYGGAVGEAQEHSRRLTALARAIDTDLVLAAAESIEAGLALAAGDYAGAAATYERLARCLTGIGALSDAARMHRLTSVARRPLGDLAGAAAALETGEHLAVAAHSRGTLSVIRSDLADVRLQQGSSDAERAVAVALETSLSVGNLRAVGTMRTRLGVLHEDPATVARASLELWPIDSKRAGAAIAHLLKMLRADHPLQATGPTAIVQLEGRWGSILDPHETQIVRPYLEGTPRSAPPGWEERTLDQLRTVAHD
jgi:hypothetical protein